MTSPQSDDPARKLADYYPVWLDNLADDVTLEGSAMDGFVQGAKVVRTMLVSIRALYEYQRFNYAGPYGENGWIEDYTAGIRGEPIANFTVVTRNAAGQTQHVVGPEHTAALVQADRRRKFAGTPRCTALGRGRPRSRRTPWARPLIN